MTALTRRAMIQRTLAGAAGAALAGRAPAVATARTRIRGASEQIGVAVVGLRQHGKTHIRQYLGMDDVRLVALCDVDDTVLQREAATVEQDGGAVKKYLDLRALLDDPDVDAVSIATPNHWHALATVWACQAGKDVCVEKPVSHSIWEGRKMVEAARRYDRLVQADLDKRSQPDWAAAAAFVREGNLGRVTHIRAFDYKLRESIGRLYGPGPVPAAVDYNLWMGPAPMLPLRRRSLHYDWHWQWATGNSEIGNNGPHQLDFIRWAIGKDTLPQTVVSFGGRFGYVDDGETPNTHVVFYEWDGIPMIYESRGLSRAPGTNRMDNFAGITATGTRVVHEHQGNGPNDDTAIFCEHGYLYGNRVFDNDGRLVRDFDEPQVFGPQERFIQAVRSRRVEDLHTDILEGHLSTALCHLGNISYMLGSEAAPEDVSRAVASHEMFERAYQAFREHLGLHGVDVAANPPVLGPVLTFNSQSERFEGNRADEANLFLKDTYRPPFVIREEPAGIC
jgi:predicted dehydrogenase